LLKDTALYLGHTHTSCKISAWFNTCLVPRGELSPIKRWISSSDLRLCWCAGC